MAVLDPTTPLGQVRLRIGDWHDLVILPDAVIQATLDDTNNNVPRSAQRCAIYILATLSQKGHKKIGLMEIWGSDVFDNYMTYLNKVVMNPLLNEMAPVPYVPASTTDTNPLERIADDWKAGYVPGATVLPYLPFGTPVITNEPT